MKRLLQIVVLLFFYTNVLAQDPQYSQFYAAPLYLNPAFAGTAKDHRFNINYRNQWPSLPQAYTTAVVSYDINMKNLNSGFGIMINTDKAGTVGLRSSTVNFAYSYKIHIMEKIVLSPAVNFGYGTRNLNFNKLVLGDQLRLDGDPYSAPIDPALKSYDNANFFDFASGLLAYSKIFWFGISVYHMNQPNQSFLGEISRLPMKKSLHGGVRIPLYKGPLKKERISSIAPSFIYKDQGNFDQLDLGFHFHYNPIMAGFWYRGIPVKQSVADNVNQDAISVLLGLRFENFDVGYSYDLTTSKLGPASGGAHEISLVYQIDLKVKAKTKRKEKFIPCPTF